MDLVIRTDSTVLGIHADDGIDASCGYSWMMIDPDNWGENDAIAAGGAFSFHRGERVSDVELVRHTRTSISADGSLFQWKQDVGIIFTLESGILSVVKSNWFDLDFDIQRHPLSADLAIRQPYVSPQAELNNEVAVAMEFISI